jgi:hypothetical protein
VNFFFLILKHGEATKCRHRSCNELRFFFFFDFTIIWMDYLDEALEEDEDSDEEEKTPVSNFFL